MKPNPPWRNRQYFIDGTEFLILSSTVTDYDGASRVKKSQDEIRFCYRK
jgi:hypothetical protein